MKNKRRTANRRRLVTTTVVVLLALLLSLGQGLIPGLPEAPTARAANPAPVQVYYMPMPEADVLPLMQAIDPRPTSPMHSVFSIVAVRDGTNVYYDHWEDGYEADLANPASGSTTLVLGDGDASNGCAGDFYPTPVGTCTNAQDVVNAGTVLTYRDDTIAIPRGTPAPIRYDARDKIGGSQTLAITRATWASTSNTLLAGAFEVYDTTIYGTSFELPVGENPPLASNDVFELTSPFVMASEDDTSITIDYNNDGTTDVSTTLDEGQSYNVPITANVQPGAKIESNKPVQVTVFTGDIGSSYEARFLTLYPTQRWDASYYTPVGMTNPAIIDPDGTPNSGDEYYDDPVHVWLYNPNADPININYQTQTTSGIIPVASKGVVPFEMPLNEGAHFWQAGGSLFNAISTVDSNQTAGASNSAHDWGFTLIPERGLSTAAIVGWGPGRDPTSSTNPSENGSPVWVTAASNTTLYVDYNGDGGPLTAPDGTPYDTTYSVSALQMRTLYDPDGDQTGMKVFTTNGALITAAWGQDPITASASAPGLDAGTTVLPLASLDFTKTAELVVDANSNGLVDYGDTLQYTLRLENVSNVNATNVVVEDSLDPNTTYVTGSTTRDAASLSDNSPPATAFPLDEGGYSVGTLNTGAVTVLVFRVVVNDPLPDGVESVTNTAVMTSDHGSVLARVVTPVRVPVFEVSKESQKPNDPVQPGDTLTYVIKVINTSDQIQTGITVSDPLPPGTTYVPNSTFIDAPQQPIRSTEYYIGGGAGFSGTTYDLVLKRPLAPNYFVIIQGSSTLAESGPNENYVRLTQDPYGTGDLGASLGNDVIRLERTSGAATWIGVVIVVESVTSNTTAGFTLRDVQAVAHAGTATSGTDASASNWSNLNKVLLMGGFNGAGCTTADPDKGDMGTCHTRLYPSGANTINWTRDAASVDDALTNATSTVMAVEWGSEWTVQRVRVTGSAGGDKMDEADEWDKAALGASVARDQTWVWGTGHAQGDNKIAKNAEGQAITLGNGLSQNASESQVAVGMYKAISKDVEVYAMTHPSLAVDYRWKPDGDADAGALDVTVDAASPNRMALSYQGNDADEDKTPKGMFSARYASDTSVRLEVQATGKDWAAWVQGIDFADIAGTGTNIPGGPPPTLASGYTLEPGQGMKVTWQVTVDSPPPAGVSAIVNTVNVTSDQDPGPNEATVTDLLGSLIGDYIWYDLDGDGNQDPGEPGIPNVDVILHPLDGQDIGAGAGNPVTKTTGADGTYTFILPTQTGNFRVEVKESSLPAGLTQTGDPDGLPLSNVFDLNIPAVGTSRTDVDFGYQPSGQIDGTVYDDLDTSGGQDPGEPGLKNVDVGLYYADGVTPVLDSDGNLLVITTDDNGNYRFDNLPGGDYVIVVDPNGTTLPYDVTNWEDPDGPAPNGDSRAAVTLPAGGSVTDQDFGYAVADLLTKTVDKASAQPGDTLTYNLTARYPGDDLLSNVRVTDNTPSGTKYVGDSDTPEATIGEPAPGGTGAIIWNLGSNVAQTGGGQAFSPGGTGSWGTAKQIDTNVGADSTDGLPDITIDASGYIHVVFVQNAADTYYTKSTNNGTTWTTPVKITSTTAETKDRSAAVAVDSSGAIHVVMDNENKNVYYRKSTDGGVNWVPAVTSVAKEIDSAAGDSADNLPDIAVDSSDNIHVVFNHDGANTYYTASTNGGTTWSTPLNVTADPNTNKDRNAALATDGSGNVHVVIDDENKNVFYRKRIAGGTWIPSLTGKGTEIDTATGDNNDRFPDIAVDLGTGDLHVAFNQNGAFTFYTKSTDGGVSWSTPLAVTASADGKDKNVAIAVDNCGNVHVAIDDDNQNVFYRTSVDGGATFSTAVEVDAAGGDNKDGFPAIAVNNSSVHVAFDNDGENVYYNKANRIPCVVATTTSMKAQPTLVTSGDTVTIMMTVTAQEAVNNISPTTPAVVEVEGGANCTGITPVDVGPHSVTAGGSATFSWTCTAAAGGVVPGSVRFQASASGTDWRGNPASFALAKSNSVLMAPVLSFQVTVDENITASVVKNTGYLSDQKVITNPSPSNEVQTGIEKPATAIGDHVWLDEDGDGVQDAGEAGIPNVKVELVDDQGAVVATTWTDASGGYVFGGVVPGTYTVRIDTTSLPDPDGAGPAGLHPTYDEDGGLNHQSSVTVAAGDEHMTADFGYNWATPGETNTPESEADPRGAIGDRLWVDADGEGDQDPGEPGLGGAGVVLNYDSDGDGIIDKVYGTTTTDEAGNYIFDELPPGIYEVVVVGDATLPSPGDPAVSAGQPPSGYDLTGDPDDVVDNKTTEPVVLGPGDVFVNADFGYQPTGESGKIGDIVWLDADADGVGPNGNGASPGDDDDEEGIANVSVSLIRDTNGNGQWDAGEPIIATDITDENGAYEFTGLPLSDAGDGNAADADYLVWVNDTGNVLGEQAPTYDSDGSAPAAGQVTGLGITATTLADSAGNREQLDQDFGYAPPGHETGEGLIGDTIYLDRANYGTADPGEGLEGVRVWLYDSSGTTLLRTTYTDENGNYTFGGLDPAGTYQVWVDTSTLPGAGLTNTEDPDTPSPGDSKSTINLGSEPGGITLDEDFGYRDLADPNTIEGSLWNDKDADGLLEGTESGRFENVKVALYDSDGDIVAYTYTDGNGLYQFAGLPDGTYTVDVVDDGGVLNGYWHSLGTADTDNNSQEDPYTVTVDASQRLVDWADFGYYADSGALGNWIWNDLNGDGIQNDGATGIPNVEVKLEVTYPGDSKVTLTTTTDASGYYRFDNLLLDEDYNGDTSTLPEPSYQISVDLNQAALAGYASASPTGAPGSTPYNDSNNPAGTSAQPVQGQTDVSAAADTTDPASNDFGFLSKTAVIGSYVWLDENSDGYQDSGEAGIANVRVELSGTDAYGNAVSRETWTDAHGGYLFTDLVGGSYTVSVDQGTLPKDQDGATAMSQTTHPVNSGSDFGNQDNASGYAISLAHGEENLTADFGFNWNPNDDVNGPGDNPGVGSGTAAIGDRIWVDVDGKGDQDPEEPGVAGVVVNLYDDDDEDGVYDNLVATTTTDATGNYIFDGLTPGAYVVEVDPSNFAAGAPLYGWKQTGDPDYFGQDLGATPPFAAQDNKTTTPVVVAPGDVSVNTDFGYDPRDKERGSIGDKVWLDQDADGVGPDGNGLPGDDNAEYGIPGVTVALIKDEGVKGVYEPGVDQIIATDVTDANGDYLFSGLAVGLGADYIVWVNDTDNVLGELAPTYDKDGAAGGGSDYQTDSVLGLSSVQNLTLASDPAHDFGYAPPGHETGEGIIGDTIFRDLDTTDGNAFNPAVDQPLEGVVVELLDGQNNVIAKTTTDENGHYYFGNLPVSAGGVTYTVRVDTTSLPSGLTSNTVDPDGGTANQTTLSLTTANPNRLDQDLGYAPAGYTSPQEPGPNAGSIGSEVWKDTDADGVRDAGETGIGGVTIDLYADTNGNGTVDPGEPLMGTETTASDGTYTFDGLPVGNYVVDVTDTAGVLGGYWHSLHPTGASGTTDGQSKTDPHAVSLTPGAGLNYQAADFGYYVDSGALGNWIWNDANADGVQNEGPGAGIAGVEMQLDITYPDGTVVTVVTVTEADGSYSFGNLLLDEDYNGNTSTTPEPSYKISVKTQPGTDALATYPYVSPVSVDGSTPYNDSNNPNNTPAQPVQGQAEVSAAQDNTDPASYDFGFSGNPTGVEGVVVGSFEAEWQGDVIVLTWATVSERDIQGFDVYRATAKDGERTKLNANLIPGQAPGSPVGKVYQYEDDTAQEGTAYYYWLEGIDLRGGTRPYGPAVISPYRVLLPMLFKSP